jgi:hypothetical protein
MPRQLPFTCLFNSSFAKYPSIRRYMNYKLKPTINHSIVVISKYQYELNEVCACRCYWTH